MDVTSWRRRFGAGAGAVAGLALIVVGGCDDNHDGTISSGPGSSPAKSVVAQKAGKTRLIYRPGSPLASARVAGVIRKRLASLGIPEKDIRIGGEQIHVDVPQDKAAAAKQALAGGRLEIYLFDEQADPFAVNTADHAERYEVKSEALGRGAGGKTLHYLVAPVAKREQLLTYLAQHSTGAKGLVGPVFDGASEPRGHRSYYVRASDPVRGELVKAAAARKTDGGAALVIELEGQGKASVRWAAKHQARFVLLVDELVVATVAPEGPVKDGKLAFPLADRGDPAATLAVATAMAKRLDGVAFSHLVTFVKERSLDRSK